MPLPFLSPTAMRSLGFRLARNLGAWLNPLSPLMKALPCVLIAAAFAPIAAAAMDVNEAVSGLRAGSLRQQETVTALQSEGRAALPVLEQLIKSAIPGVAVRAAKIRTWIILELDDSALRPEVRQQLVDLKRIITLAPGVWGAELRKQHPEVRSAEEVLTQAAASRPFPFRTCALLYDHLPEMGMHEYWEESCRRKIRDLITENIGLFPHLAGFRVAGLSSAARAMLLNALAHRKGGLPEGYEQWLVGHEDTRNGLAEGMTRELARLEAAGDVTEVLGLYQSVINPGIRTWFGKWLNARRALVAQLDPATLSPSGMAGYLEVLHDPAAPLAHDPIYQTLRVTRPELAAHLMPQSLALEAVWLAEHGQVSEGFRLAQTARSEAAAERIGTWLREHPAARQPRIPVVGDPLQPGFGGFIAGFAPVGKGLDPAAEDRLAGAFDDYADELWLDLARRTNQHRLYFLCMVRRDRLMDGVQEVAERPASGPGLRALGELLASRPPWLDKLAPERIRPFALAHLAGGMLDGGASPEIVAAMVKRWLPHDPEIFDKLTSDELKPVVIHGKARP